MTIAVRAQATIEKLSLLHAGILQAASLAMKAGVETAQNAARGTNKWKDRTGATRASIRGEVFGTRGKLVAGGASRFLESGTVPHVIAARNAAALRFVKNGQVFFRKWVNHPGTRATRFLTEARNRGEQALEWGTEFYVGEAMRRL